MRRINRKPCLEISPLRRIGIINNSSGASPGRNPAVSSSRSKRSATTMQLPTSLFLWQHLSVALQQAPGFHSRNGPNAEELSAQKLGLIHATVVLHVEKGRLSNRSGFDEVRATVTGLFALEGTLCGGSSQ